MAPEILPNTTTPWLALGVGLILLAIGIYAFIKKKFDITKRIGFLGTGIIAVLVALLASKSRIELHDDRVVQHIQSISAKRTEIKLDGITDVTVITFDDAGKEKESWLFSKGEADSATVMATGLWRSHSERIVQFLEERGIKVTRRQSK
ncbi:hypothetical protein N9B63_04730 [Akkermansiaceae bacterium]|nr:hypothetical protein [Akkermansiaceae bacterium]